MPIDHCEPGADKDLDEGAAQNQAENAPSEAKDQGAERVPEGEAAPAASPPEAGPAEAEPEDLAVQLAETRDQLLRKAADFENFRKRMNQEKQMAIEYANQSLLLDIIPIIDDFERALQAAESSKDFAALLEGITMIEKRLTGQLESKWGLKRFNSAGELFDPNRHEALMMEKSPEVSEPTVQEDLLKGYLLKDRVIRAAKVKVVMPGGSG
ncbi:MAG: nucleotide exchange factor GrpE [Treponema sp.]|jgi:molecular chaperone GrpE|nr:nucleotide exchange factor GrpE [Treponema sp.]